MPNLLNQLVEQHVLDPPAAEAVRRQVGEGRSLDEALAACEGVDQRRLMDALATRFALQRVNLDDAPPDAELIARFPAKLLIDYQLVPLRQQNGKVLLATSKPFDTAGVDELRFVTGDEFDLALAPAEEIERCIKQHLGIGADTVQSMVRATNGSGIQVVEEEETDLDLAGAAEDASVIRLVNQVLTEAIELRATDVHIEPFEQSTRVRYRIDGVLAEAHIPAEVRRFHAAIVSRLKILAHLDIAEKRLPQDGRIKLRIKGREIDVRVSVIPMLHGEAVVLRLLDRSSTLLGLKQLGMAEDDLAVFSKVLSLPHGIVLVTGPTGSGKTTTLYAALSRINDIERKIVTIEDPIEYQLAGVNQIQVSSKAGLTFARGLRSILRHDPDVILIGEIRDRETA
ncbi:MAG: GspE/PulE family protein, partial [Rhodospirillales bacterium]|nr:GspE/PulE family protein [Rhodospirillales bacterium]